MCVCEGKQSINKLNGDSYVAVSRPSCPGAAWGTKGFKIIMLCQDSEDVFIPGAVVIKQW